MGYELIRIIHKKLIRYINRAMIGKTDLHPDLFIQTLLLRTNHMNTFKLYCLYFENGGISFLTVNSNILTNIEHTTFTFRFIA